MFANYPEPELENCVAELCIVVRALTESHDYSSEAYSPDALVTAADSADEYLAECFEHSSRMSEDTLSRMYRKAQKSLHEVQSQLLAARQLQVDNERTLERAEWLTKRLLSSLELIVPIALR